MDEQQASNGNANAPVTGMPMAEPAASTIPSVWPGAFGVYKYSKQVVKRNWTTILLFIAAIIVVAIVDRILNDPSRPVGLRIGGTIVTDIIGILISMAVNFTYLAGIDERKLSFGEALSKCTPMLTLKYIAAVIIEWVILTISILLLLVPFFFVLPRLALVSYFIVDKNMGPLKAIGASWRVTKGHSLEVWGVILTTIAMALLMITIIGIPFSLYFLFMYGAALAVLYKFVTQNQK